MTDFLKTFLSRDNVRRETFTFLRTKRIIRKGFKKKKPKQYGEVQIKSSV